MNVPVIDYTCDSPEENLSFDEALLARGCEALRFWESPVPFVVLGRSGKAEKEVDLAACEAAGVPVLRRCSGGSAVLVGPGCLNYTLVLSLAARPALISICQSYCSILARIAEALAMDGLEVRGSDILLRGRKVSGNAQRRLQGWLLHHGTLLYGLDVRLLEHVLLEPPRQPPHRQGRSHRAFVGTVPLRVDQLKQCIASAWSGKA
jgi:lipoate-protein ligase A